MNQEKNINDNYLPKLKDIENCCEDIQYYAKNNLMARYSTEKNIRYMDKVFQKIIAIDMIINQLYRVYQQELSDIKKDFNKTTDGIYNKRDYEIVDLSPNQLIALSRKDRYEKI